MILPRYCLIWFVCVCVSGGAYSCMHLCIASWQNVGHGGTAAPWHAVTSHSLHYHCMCPSSVSLSPPSLSVSLFLFVPVHLFFAWRVSFTMIIRVFLNFLQLKVYFFTVFCPPASPEFLFTWLCFLRHHCLLVTHHCHLPVSPQFTSK